MVNEHLECECNAKATKLDNFLLEVVLLRTTMSPVDVDVYLVSTLVEGGTIVEDAHWDRLILVVDLADGRCHHLLALEGEEDHIV